MSTVPPTHATTTVRRPWRALGVVVAPLLLAGCATAVEADRDPERAPSSSPSSSPPPSSSSPPSEPGAKEVAAGTGDTPAPAPSRRVVPASPDPVRPAGPEPSDGRPQAATLSVPALGIDDVRVETYRGTTDDAPGTAIQDDGALASPHGPRGGTGPGGVGNYLVTGHRLSSTQVFLDLPSLGRGERVQVRSGGRTFVYEVRDTRKTSFRDPASLAAQRAAVPGRPGVEPTRAMITLSTCATPEDRAVGNFWSDEFGNPEHRIDKIGVLVAARDA